MRIVGMNRIGIICTSCLADIAAYLGVDGYAIPFTQQHPQVIDAVFAYTLHLREAG